MAVNDNINVSFDDGKCFVDLSTMTIVFNHIYEAGDFISEYYEREL